ncbi:MAG: MmgE/PrpD family protein [Nitriliruptoraceae bacterium]
MELESAITELGRFAAALRWESLDAGTRARALDVLLDTIGVTLAGARTPELAALQATVIGDAGASRPLGTELRLSPTTAAWLDGTAACCLELDEGNKRARGHPAAHVVPAALAMAPQVRVDGPTWLSAFVAGHEVATRVAAATHLHAGVHPHGNASIAGAATTAARLLALDAPRIAAAIDAATALPLATDFAAALDGSFVRNTWIGQANASGIAAARLAAAGLADVDGRGRGTLGRVLGDLDVDLLVDGLGEHLSVTDGYFKRHASCSYTHPPADAAIALREGGVSADEVVGIEVRTHHLAAALDRHATPTRLAAMFSIPYVVAATLVHGRFDTSSSDAAARDDPAVRRLVAATTVTDDPDLDARLPDERAAAVTVRLVDGSEHTIEVPNPIGDASHHPLTRTDLIAKLDGLLQPGEAISVAAIVDGLPTTTDAASALTHLP